MTGLPPDAEFFALQRALAGEYSLERELGRGGMGVVYLAREVQLERLVAIKVLNPGLAASPEARDRFVREARTAANLSHPNIVPIHRVGESHGFVFFVMTFIDGETLGARIREKGPLNASAAAKLLRETAWALGHAHDHDVIHRDVKPDNILIERETGRALVTDFGIARVGAGVDGDGEKVMGTAHFMSPEQGRGQSVDARSDLYSLGVVAHYTLTGRVPFDGTNSSAIIAKHLHAPAPMLVEVPSVPRMLAEAVDKCLRKEPGSRYANAKELADALEADAMARLELPAPIRAWLQTQNPLRGGLLLWTTIGSLNVFVDLLRREYGSALGTAAVTAVPVLTLIGFHVSQTRRALLAGYSLSDLRFALDRWRDARREDLTFTFADIPRWMRLVRAGTWISVGVMLAAVTWAAVAFPSSAAGNGRILTILEKTILYLGIGTGASFLVSNSLGIPLVGRPRGIILDGLLRKWFWGTGLGAWVGKSLGKGRKVPAQLVNRRTEAALSLAAQELYEALPKEQRKSLREVPAVVRRLEGRAVEMRRHVEDLSGLLARAERDSTLEEVTRERAVRKQLTESRDKAKAELGTTVAALETIRLGLLKLHGGVDVANTITELVERAQDVAADLDRLAEAERAVELFVPGGGDETN